MGQFDFRVDLDFSVGFCLSTNSISALVESPLGLRYRSITYKSYLYEVPSCRI